MSDLGIWQTLTLVASTEGSTWELWQTIVLIAGGIATILGLIITIFKITKSVKQKLNEGIKNTGDKILNDVKPAIICLLRKEIMEMYFKIKDRGEIRD